jgi:hypothetical protein
MTDIAKLAASLERLLSRASSEEENTDSILLATAELALALAKHHERTTGDHMNFEPKAKS